MIILLLVIPSKQDLFRWLMLVGTCVSISKSDVDDGVSLAFS